MASNAPVPAKTGPLSFMTRITTEIYLYTPDDGSRTISEVDAKSASLPPKLILCASWMGAHDKHIAKYLSRYQVLYPSASILLIRTEPKHIIIPSLGRKITAPAVPIIRSILPPVRDETQPRLLVHLFSNAGSSVMSHLYGHFAATARPGTDDDVALPLHATVYDSTPGERTYWGSVLAFAATVPKGWRRMLAVPVIHLFMILLSCYYALPGRDMLQQLAKRHNNPRLNREVRRAYCYSAIDVSIPWRGIERHAAQARERGYADVRLEKFEGSDHVAHMPAQPERYWSIVRETWEGK